MLLCIKWDDTYKSWEPCLGTLVSSHVSLPFHRVCWGWRRGEGAGHHSYSIAQGTHPSLIQEERLTQPINDFRCGRTTFFQSVALEDHVQGSLVAWYSPGGGAAARRARRPGWLVYLPAPWICSEPYRDGGRLLARECVTLKGTWPLCLQPSLWGSCMCRDVRMSEMSDVRM